MDTTLYLMTSAFGSIFAEVPRVYASAPGRINLVVGTLSLTRNGDGFVVPDAGGKDVFVPGSAVDSAMDGDRVVEKEVRTGRRMDTMVEISDGLGAGDRVVLNPGSDLKSGTRVKIPEK